MFSQPSGARYQRRVTVSIGDSVELPDPVGLPLDTEPLKAWVRRSPTRDTHPGANPAHVG